jgi:hypothetical protein
MTKTLHPLISLAAAFVAVALTSASLAYTANPGTGAGAAEVQTSRADTDAANRPAKRKAVRARHLGCGAPGKTPFACRPRG